MSTALLVMGLLALVSLLMPRPVEPPTNPLPETTTILASPRDAKVLKVGAMSETTSESYLGPANSPINQENIVPDGKLPKTLRLKVQRPGYREKTIEFSTPLLIRGFLSKPYYPQDSVVELEPESWSARIDVWAKERWLSLASLGLISIFAFALAQQKGRAARRADLLEKSKANAGKDPYVGTMLKEFLILDLLGRGNFGMVYRAIPEARAGDKNAEKHAVAIKVSTNLDPKAIQRFYQELDVARQAEHPNNVRIYDKGLTPDDSPFLVMELLQGKSLMDLITEEVEFAGPGEPGDRYLASPPKQVAKMLEPVVEGLQHAHDQGVVHRDLNPNNIMVLDNGGTKILDFGLSKILANKALTMTQDAGAGTLSYLPYEQIVGFGKVDARADQFSLGAMMYHMLAGTHPFSNLPFEALTKVSQKLPARSLVEAAPHISAETAAVVEKMLHHDPDQRFPSVRAAFDAFKASL